jgi:hypothetical protein
MLRIELDWAGEGEPEFGPQAEYQGITIEPGSPKGPAGWPTVVVFAAGASGAESGPRLVEWLTEYCGGDDEQATELADMAESV